MQVIWNSVGASRVVDIERILCYFTRSLMPRIGMGMPGFSCASHCHFLGLQLLESRFLQHDIILLFKIINGTSFSWPLEQISIRVPRLSSRFNQLKRGPRPGRLSSRYRSYRTTMMFCSVPIVSICSRCLCLSGADDCPNSN